MGLAIAFERPRNKGQCSGSVAATISVTQDGNFANPYANATINPTANNRSHRYPYAIVIERIWVDVRNNTLDALSTNTLTLVTGGSDNGSLTITDSSDFVDIDGLNILVDADDPITFRWNSDSVGNCTLRVLGYSFRAVSA